ncbi:hypothetical protein FRC01_013763, partial [Tulasnella sp. 417]
TLASLQAHPLFKMGKSVAPVAKVIERFSDRVSEKLESGRRFLKNKTHFTTATTLVNPKPKSVSAGPITNIIMICLSYPSLFWNFGTSMHLTGPKHDFCLLLDHFKYGELDNSVEFTLLHDFDVVRTGSDGQQKLMCKTDTSKAAIGISSDVTSFQMEAIKDTMQCVAPGGKVVFYCLPYNYEEMKRGVRAKRATRTKQEIPMIQISAARLGQSAYSNEFKGGYYGQLTWCWIQYLKTTTESTIEGLTSYLYANCDPTGAQLPQ